jgi:molecular chaperone DnaK
VGIDLGTTFSVIAHLDPFGRPTSIPNGLGEILTPSAVLFDNDDVIVGREAVKGSVLAPDLFADCFKRDMGNDYYHRKLHGTDVPPEVLSALVLRQLKEDAERRLGRVQQAVITVPAFFDESRRKATQDAGRLAGLEVLDIINEPTAAALSFGYQQGLARPDQKAASGPPRRILVYDLGGGTFDVTLLEIEGQQFRAVATDGDVRLGGRDFDERLVEYIAEQFRQTHGMDPRADPQDAMQLWQDAVQAKHTLSQRSKAPIACAYGGVRLRLEISREQFEEMTRDLLDRTETTASLVVRQAGFDWSHVDAVLPVGGATRMPMVVEMLRRVTGKPPDVSASPDEAVAHGAALYAATLHTGDRPAVTLPCRLINVNSHSLGVVGIDTATRRRVSKIVVPKNTPLPCRVVRSFVTDRDGQRNVKVPVVEGESPDPAECIFLGECIVRDLPPALPKGTPVQVEFSYVANGRISVSARVAQARQSAHVEFDRQQRRSLGDLKTWLARVRGIDESGDLYIPTNPPALSLAACIVCRRRLVCSTTCAHGARTPKVKTLRASRPASIRARDLGRGRRG